jgi:hypothetical protein
MAAAVGIALPERAPRLAFSARLDVVVWWPEEIAGGA